MDVPRLASDRSRCRWVDECILGEGASTQDVANDGAVDVGEAVVAAAVTVGEAFVIEAQAVEEGRVEVVDVDGVLDGFGAVVVGASVGEAALDSASGHPDREALVVVIAAILLAAVGGAAELAAPEDEGVFEEASGGEVLKQGGSGAIEGAGVLAKGGFEVLMLVPAAKVHFDEAGAGFGEAASQETLPGEGVDAGLAHAV